MGHLSDHDVREVLRPHRDGGPLSRLYAQGEITEATYPALGMLSVHLEEAGRHGEAERIAEVMWYVAVAGERPAAARWLAKL